VTDVSSEQGRRDAGQIDQAGDSDRRSGLLRIHHRLRLRSRADGLSHRRPDEVVGEVAGRSGTRVTMSEQTPDQGGPSTVDGLDFEVLGGPGEEGRHQDHALERRSGHHEGAGLIVK
jgi:hypothetical protein